MSGVTGAPHSDTAPRFVVTGAAGFIGAALCRRLQETGSVHAIVRRAVEGPWHESSRLHLGDDEVPPSLLEGVDVVFHLASKTHDVMGTANEDEYERVNVEGTASLLRAAGQAGVRRVVFLSSVKGMGEGGYDAQDETSVAQPTTPYGRTKLAAENLVLDGGLVPEAVVLRLPLVYGPGVKGNLERMIDAIDRGRFPPVAVTSNRRSMVHVDDVVEAVMLAARHDAATGRTFIITDGHPYSTREIYDTIRGALDKAPSRVSIPTPAMRVLAMCGDIAETIIRRRLPFNSAAYEKLTSSAYYDGGAAVRNLGFNPRYTLARAMPEMVDRFRQVNPG